MKQNNYFIFLLFLFSFIIIGKNTLGLEVDSLGLGANPTLPDYIDFMFTWLIGIGITASLISFVIGAFGLIIPNPEAHGDAKDRMKGAIYGLFLVLSCFLVLKTINVKFVEIGPLSKIGDVYGVFYTNGSDYRTAPTESADTEGIPNDFKKLKYVCKDNKGDPIFVWKFNQKNFGDYKNASVTELKCGDIADVGLSFKWKFKSSGVYLCLGSCSGNTCNGMSPDPMPIGGGEVNETFAGKVQNIVFVKNEKTGNGYGAIFHKVKNLDQAGLCISGKTYADGNCVNIGNTSLTQAADIFEINSTPETSGDGVNFFSNPFGWTSGSDSGYYEIASNQIRAPKKEINDATDIQFSWSGTDTTEAYQIANENFQKSPGSVQIRGSYLVMITSTSGFYCKTYTKDIPDLYADPVTKSGGDITGVIIYPLAK